MCPMIFYLQKKPGRQKCNECFLPVQDWNNIVKACAYFLTLKTMPPILERNETWRWIECLKLEFRKFPTNVLKSKRSMEESLLLWHRTANQRLARKLCVYGDVYKDVWSVFLIFLHTLSPHQSLVCSSSVQQLKAQQRSFIAVSTLLEKTGIGQRDTEEEELI